MKAAIIHQFGSVPCYKDFMDPNANNTASTDPQAFTEGENRQRARLGNIVPGVFLPVFSKASRGLLWAFGRDRIMLRILVYFGFYLGIGIM